MSKAAMMLTAIAAMNMDNQFGNYLDNPLGLKPYRSREPKNKYGLSDDEIEAISEMTPKEKKKFFKSRASAETKE